MKNKGLFTLKRSILLIYLGKRKQVGLQRLCALYELHATVWLPLRCFLSWLVGGTLEKHCTVKWNGSGGVTDDEEPHSITVK